MDPRLNKVRHPTYDLSERPFLVIWEVTRACDLACKHCRAEAMPVPDPRQLTTADSLKLIDQVTGSYLGLDYFTACKDVYGSICIFRPGMY